MCENSAETIQTYKQGKKIKNKKKGKKKLLRQLSRATWGVRDSDPRTRKGADLQSAAIATMRTPQLTFRLKAACRTWTHDPEITNHVLYQLS